MKPVLVTFSCVCFLLLLVGCGGGGGSSVLPATGSTAVVPDSPSIDTDRAAAGLGQSGGGIGLVVVQTTIAQEEPLVNTKASALKSALNEKNVDAATNLFHESAQADYKTIFSAQPEKLPALATALENANLTILGEEYGSITTRPRRAELTVVFEGKTFLVDMIKVGENWLFMNL
ncbi:MAG: hypothetical protein KKB51_01190 [Candidatus Riflebacteria bacterium]|nr:hypothetical protein [Candidatus Riflebacteria bacterium]